MISVEYHAHAPVCLFTAPPSAGMFSAERVAYAKKKEEDMFCLEEPELREAHTINYEW